MDLDLATCPICRARGNFARGTTEVEGRSRATYECVECGSVLVRLGDDLWMEGDRWAYQKVSRADAAFLLHRPLTVGELKWLAGNDQQPLPVGPQPPVASPRRPASSDWPQATVRQSSAILDQAAGPAASGEGREVRKAQGAVPVGVPPPTRVPAKQQSADGPPLLLNSMLFILLCLIMYVTAMIATKGLRDRTPLESTPPVSTPQGELLLTRIPLVTQTPLPAEISLSAETPALVAAPLPTETPPVNAASLSTVLPSLTPAPSLTGTLSPPESLLPAANQFSGVQLEGVTDHLGTDGSYYVLGEVLNTTAENIRSVEIVATFYDADGQVVGTGSTFSQLSIIEPGDMAPFKLVTPASSPPFARYELRLNYVATDEKPLRLEVLTHSAFDDQSGGYHITGQVRNPNGTAVKQPRIIATYYNAASQVVDVEAAVSQADVLEPGEVSPFEVVLVVPPGDLDYYALHTEAVPQ